MIKYQHILFSYIIFHVLNSTDTPGKWGKFYCISQTSKMWTIWALVLMPVIPATQVDHSSKLAQTNSSQDPISKILNTIKRGLVEWLTV
jgi:hypothetical protein